MENNSEIKLFSAQEARRQTFMKCRNYVHQDFEKLVDQTTINLLKAIESIHARTLGISLPEFYRKQPKLAEMFLGKLVNFFQERGFIIGEVASDNLTFVIQWRTPSDLLPDIFFPLAAIKGNESEAQQQQQDQKNIPQNTELITQEQLKASVIREKQILFHREHVLHDLTKLKKQVLEKIAEAQTRFEAHCTITFEECHVEYAQLLFVYISQELTHNHYQVVSPLTHPSEDLSLVISWTSGDSDDEEEVKNLPSNTAATSTSNSVNGSGSNISSTNSFPVGGGGGTGTSSGSTSSGVSGGMTGTTPSSVSSSSASTPTADSSSSNSTLDLDFSHWSDEKLLASLLRAGGNHALQLAKLDNKTVSLGVTEENSAAVEFIDEAKIQLVMFHTEVLKRMKNEKAEVEEEDEQQEQGSFFSNTSRNVRVRPS